MTKKLKRVLVGLSICIMLLGCLASVVNGSWGVLALIIFSLMLVSSEAV